MRTALVHDWLTGMRGGEKVLEVFCQIFPRADLFTLIHVPGRVSPIIESRRIVVSPLSRLPGIGRHYRRYLPLFPRMIERFDLVGYDLVLSTSSCVAKGARPAPGAVHVSYVHSPMRYVWDRYEDYFAPGRADPATRAAMAFLRRPLQAWDRRSAERVHVFVANSEFVADRIRRYYGREAEVIPPPVDVGRFRPAAEGVTSEWLVVSAMAPYKRLDVAILAARLAGVDLAVVGTGPEEAALRRLAGGRVRFLGWVDDGRLARLLARCRGLLFPGVEDFGIVPLEAMASGRPVVAHAEGGATETVRGAPWPGDPLGRSEGATGLLVREQTPEAFAAAIRFLEDHPETIDPAACRSRAEEFATDRFRARIREAIPRWTAGLPLPPSGKREPAPS